MRAFQAIIALSFATILAVPPPAMATHGDTAYLVGTGAPFFAETRYVTGPGYVDQYWDFAIMGEAGQDYCSLVHGGWDPDPRPEPDLPGGFSGTCNSGMTITTTGIDHYHPYPNPGAACPVNQACRGLDHHEVTVTYGSSTFQAQLIVCDNNRSNSLYRVSSTYCYDIALFSSL